MSGQDRALIDAGLVLEGGGMRGVYTAGVLDYLIDSGLWFRSVYGVSAGACHATSYVAGQRGRAIRTVVEHVGNPRYGSLRNLITTGNYFGVQYIYEDVPQKYIPFDYDAYQSSAMTLYSVVFNCRTGVTEYPAATDLRAQMPLILASSSLPMMSRMVWLDGEPYLDGGMLDAIPIGRSLADGNKKNLVILTRHRDYTKEASRLVPLMRLRYPRYPRLVEAMARRHEAYNRLLEQVYQEEAQGDTVVIQPRVPVEIDRLEKRRDRLEALYRDGYDDAEASAGAIRACFLGEL